MVREALSATSNLFRPPVPATPSRLTRPRAGSARQAIVITLSCAAVLGAFYALSQLGARHYESPGHRSQISKEQAEKLRTLAEEAEAKWEAVKRKRAQEKSPYTEDDLRIIGEAAVSRLQYESQVEGAENHYPVLKKELHDRIGEKMREESIGIENRAAIEARGKHYAEAERLFAAAAEIEERLNADYPESSFKNMQRTVFLESQARLMHAKPIWEHSIASEAAGENAFAKGDLNAAIAAIDTARETNYRLETDYRGLTPADSFRTRNLEYRLDTLRSTSLRDHALETVALAEKAVAAHRFEDLAASRKETEVTLKELAEKYPNSDYAKPEYVADIVRRAQNAAAAPDAEAVIRDLRALDTAIRRGDTTAAGMIENLRRTVMREREMYPASDLVAKDAEARVNFLFDHRTEIAVVVAAIKGSLLPMPGRQTTLVARTETTQRLYGLVMGDNPSATKDDARPVESVSYAEALAFCRRLGWLIARPVRLPDEGEFRILAGKPDAKSLAAFARAIDNSDGTAAPVPAAKADAAGFNDVLGNVGEWITPPPDAKPGDGFVAGGDAEDTLAQLAQVPVRRVNAGDHSRFTGFRFIVETGN